MEQFLRRPVGMNRLKKEGFWNPSDRIDPCGGAGLNADIAKRTVAPRQSETDPFHGHNQVVFESRQKHPVGCIEVPRFRPLV